MTVLNSRLLIVDDTGDELYEINPDGADAEGTRLRALPSGLTFPTGMTVFFLSDIYVGASRVTRAYSGSTQLDRIYSGSSTRVL